MSRLSRRDFLNLVRDGLLWLSGALALGEVLHFLDYDPYPEPPTEFDLGPAVDYPPDSQTVLSTPPAVLLHTEHGFSALSLVCTHLGCTVEQQGNGFACPCHGSRFNGDGQVIQGPAKIPLPALHVEVRQDGHLWLIIK
ncbi:MAG: QcrA and Rieske domain-containing protein [Candidatus Villigracilaceae bacterium]